MIVYYIEYTDEHGNKQVEVFRSRTVAKKRISGMTQVYKQLKKAWQEYIITRTNKPNAKPIEPPSVEEATFDLNSEGVMNAFTYLIKRGK